MPLTRSAALAVALREDGGCGVYSRAELHRLGYGHHRIEAQLAAGRWVLLGRVVVTHNAELSRADRWRAGVLHCGPRARLASFSALERSGLRGWERDEVHVLAPAGVARPSVPGVHIVLHRTTRKPTGTQAARRALSTDAVLAASSFAQPRPAAGLLAATVQQRLVLASDLALALDDAPRVRHRATLRATAVDIGMGAEALSEIDLVRLCRRRGLPPPALQRVRVEPGGRRRYLDAEWVRRDGGRVVAEVDGAVHLAAPRWFADQLRQNEIALTSAVVLRYPSVVVRTEPKLVAGQLARALGLS